jgi:transcriptional regulator with PAS, ATPase and Fis domain
LTERLFDFDEILGDSAAMQEVKERARKMALTGAPILIEGETGVGKELFARAIHSAGPTASGPFVPVNCGGIPRDLFGSELFGYSKGAFTGAREQGHAGKIEAADSGLLCLDEVGEMPLEHQPFLLRVLSERAAIEAALAEARGNLTDAAKRLGIARSTLYRKLDEYGIGRDL